jgi:hypothetical protein
MHGQALLLGDGLGRGAISKSTRASARLRPVTADRTSTGRGMAFCVVIKNTAA